MLSTAPAIDCPHANHCAGCPLIAEPYPAQLARKRLAVREALARYPELQSLEPEPTMPAEELLGYRLRAKLVADGRRLGLFARGSHDVVDIPQCRVLRPMVARAVAAVRAALPFRFPLLAIDVREADRGALLTLVVPHEVEEGEVRRAAAALREAHSEILGVAVARRAARSAQVLGGVPKPLVGLSSAPHHLAPRAPFHEAVPGGFVQAHAGQTAKLHDRLETLLSALLGGLRGRKLLELYAGAGALSLRLAQKGAIVSAIDSFRPNLARLEQAARAQGLALSTRAVSAEVALCGAERPDAVLVDPPRRGLSLAVRRALGELAPRALVYVSCEPRTLARDLSSLCQLGLSVESITPWDMIPLSEAVECITVLRAGAPPALDVLYQGRDWLAVERPPATITPEGDKFAPLVKRVRELPGYGEAVPASELEPVGSGICLFARQPEALAALELSLARGTVHYLCLARGIARQKGRVERATRAGRSSSRYRRERVIGTHSLLRVQPESGQRSQLRRHLASIGHPVLGDLRYGDTPSNRYFDERHGLDRAFVHCAHVELELEGATVTLRSDLAPDLQAVLESLETPESVDGDEAASRGE